MRSIKDGAITLSTYQDHSKTFMWHYRKLPNGDIAVEGDFDDAKISAELKPIDQSKSRLLATVFIGSANVPAITDSQMLSLILPADVASDRTRSRRRSRH